MNGRHITRGRCSLAIPCAVLLTMSLVGCRSQDAPDRAEAGVPPSDTPSHQLRINSLDGESLIAIDAGSEVSIEGETFRVDAVRAWSGLLRQPGGDPMISISLRKHDGEWFEDVLVGAEQWLRIEGFPPVLFLFTDHDITLYESLLKRMRSLPAGRWGVLDSGRVHWFESFVPGTGVERADGSIVTLLEYAAAGNGDEAPRIRIRIESDESSTERWVPADDVNNTDIRVEVNPMFTEMVALVSNRAAYAEVFHIKHGSVQDLGRLSEGRSWSADAVLELRLEQVAPEAAPVLRERSPLLEAVLVGSERRIRVRQGEAVRVGESTLRFVRNLELN